MANNEVPEGTIAEVVSAAELADDEGITTPEGSPIRIAAGRRAYAVDIDGKEVEVDFDAAIDALDLARFYEPSALKMIAADLAMRYELPL